MKSDKERWLLLAILVVAAVLRLVRLDLMEFKFDEAEACRLVSKILFGPASATHPEIPLTGLVSSVGVPNPPLFIYILALPLAVVNNPLSAAVFIALSNVAAVWLCYFIGKRYYSGFVGLAAAALFALSPWAIVYSRKIWAQDLLPVFACLFLLTAHAFVVDKKPREVFWLVFLLGLMTQLHFSALGLVLVLVVVLVAGRETFHWRWFWLGIAAVAVLYLPYAWHLVSTHGKEFGALGGGESVSRGHALLASLRHSLGVSCADAMGGLMGTKMKCASVLSLVLGLLGVLGLVWVYVRDRQTPQRSMRLVLLVWLIAPLVCLVVARVKPLPHYFIILYPLPFLGLALALEKLGERLPMLRKAGPAICLIVVLALSGFVLGEVIRQGGTKGEYGVGYRHKADVVRFVASENPARPFVWSSDFTLKTNLPPEYRYLLSEELRRRDTPYQTDKPAFGYVVLNTLRDSLSPEGVAATKELRQEKFGPLTVFVVPLQ